MAEKKINSDLRIQGKTITTGVQDPGGGSSTEYWKTDGTKGTPAGGGAITQKGLTDAATLSWDLATEPSAYLLATSVVGNTRMLPNSILTPGVDGENYQLVFQQDAIGGRSVTFDTSFEVVGSFDLRPGKVSIILLNFQDGIGRVVVTSWEGITTGLSNAGAGEFLLLNDTIKSLIAGTNITLTSTPTSITIDAEGGGGGEDVRGDINAYVHPDATGTPELDNPSAPFSSIDNAIAALPVTTGEIVNIHLRKAATTYPINSIPGRNIRIISELDAVVVEVVDVSLRTTAPTNETILELILPNGEFKGRRTSYGVLKLDCNNCKVKLYLKTLTIEGQINTSAYLFMDMKYLDAKIGTFNTNSYRLEAKSARVIIDKVKIINGGSNQEFLSIGSDLEVNRSTDRSYVFIKLIEDTNPTTTSNFLQLIHLYDCDFFIGDIIIEPSDLSTPSRGYNMRFTRCTINYVNSNIITTTGTDLQFILVKDVILTGIMNLNCVVGGNGFYRTLDPGYFIFKDFSIMCGTLISKILEDTLIWSDQGDTPPIFIDFKIYNLDRPLLKFNFRAGAAPIKFFGHCIVEGSNTSGYARIYTDASAGSTVGPNNVEVKGELMHGTGTLTAGTITNTTVTTTKH